jgi:hypothetical protein
MGMRPRIDRSMMDSLRTPSTTAGAEERAGYVLT